MKILPLTKIGFFNPGRLKDEEIEQSFISRIPFFQYLFEKIISEKPNSIPQHYLIIGQRGMGKTSLLVRIAAELRKVAFKKYFIALSFPEEQYNIDRLTKFWLNCLDALADALDKENNKELLTELDKAISIISKAALIDSNEVYSEFKTWCSKTGRRPVLLVDNLNLIFDKITKEETHQLRAILISPDAPILVAASANIMEDVVEYGAPFYDAFQINYLKKLSFEESIEVLQNLAKITGNINFSMTLAQHRGRLEAIYQLTGGTPRTLAILFPLIQEGFSESIQTDVDALLDSITPLYKARFEELSAQLQVVMDAIALHWDPINLEQLRGITALENATLTPQLKRLVDMGWLVKLDAYKAKGNAYELSERFFNVWYLMRRSSRRQKRELYCLTKFLESFYGTELETMAQKRLTQNCNNTDHFALNLALADAIQDAEIAEKLKNHTYNQMLDASIKDVSLLSQFDIPKGVINTKIINLVLEGEALQDNNQLLEAELKFKEALHLDEKSPYPFFGLGNLYKDYLNQFENAELAYKKAIELDEKDASPWNNLGNLYKNCLNRFEDAELAYKKAIELDEKDASPWNNLGNLYQVHLNRFEDAELVYKNAIELNEKYAFPWNNLGNLYQDYLNRFEEAEFAYKKAIELDEKYASPWSSLGNLYTYHLNRFEDAEFAYKKAIELDEKKAYSWIGLANLYSDNLNLFKDAEFAYKKAIELDEKDACVWNSLGNLYQDHLNRFEDAELAYKKAIMLDETYVYPKYNLVFLWRDKMGKINEAKKMFATIAITKEVEDSHYLNEALFAYYDNNIGIAESFINKAIEHIVGIIPNNTQDDWYRMAAISVKLGFGNSLLKVFKENEYDIIMRPFYVAIEALTLNEPLYLNSVAVEVREPAKKIIEIMEKYIA